MEFTAVGWNLFHGRDFPPDPALFTWRSRLLRIEERNETHVQVNRDLAAEFAAMLAGAEWDVALLQECPPRFAAPLARACEAEAHRVLTSRNSLGALRAAAARLNPDLIASGEGGSNLTLVDSFRCALSRMRKRRTGTAIVERRELAIHTGGRSGGRWRLPAPPPASASPTCTRPTTGPSSLPPTSCWRREAAVGWAGDSPLLFGGDLNLRPARTPAIFEELARALRPRPGRPARARSTTCSRRGLDGRRRRPAPWPPRTASCARGPARCASPTTLPSRQASPRPDPKPAERQG